LYLDFVKTVDQKQFVSAISQIAEEKGVSRDKIIETIEMAVAAAYKREYGRRGQIVRAKLDPETGQFSFTQVKLVVEPSMLKTDEEIAAEEAARAAGLPVPGMSDPRPFPRRRGEEDVLEELPREGEEEKKLRFNPEKHILLEDAKKEKSDCNVGDEFVTELEAHDAFGRIAAQTAKQVVIQRIREAERDAIFAEYKDKEGELISGIVQRVEGRTTYIDLGRTIAMLFPEEQLPNERYRIGQRFRFLVLRVELSPKGPMVLLSRSHPMMLKKLFHLEVPEVASGTVEIKSIAREAGSRSKIAVVSHAEGVDPIGSCVGQRGTRVQTVISEIGGEKIDIIEWSEKPETFVAHALSPAKVIDVTTIHEERRAMVEVPPEQLSLAIGQKGQNVRLAAKLTGWRIDIRGAHVPEASATPESAVDASAASEGAAGTEAGASAAEPPSIETEVQKNPEMAAETTPVGEAEAEAPKTEK